MNKREFLKTLGLGAIAGTAGAVAGKMTAPERTSHAKEESVYDRVMRTGEIRCGYINYYPAFRRDPITGKFEGIFFDLTERIAKEVGLSVSWSEETTFDTMVPGIETRRFDAVLSGIWPSADRARAASFTNSMFYSAVEAYVRNDDMRFDGNLKRANAEDIKIATIDGEMSSFIADDDFMQSSRLSLSNTTDISQLLLNVQVRKADITFVETAVANAYLAKNPGTIRKVENSKPVRIFANTNMLPVKEPDFLQLFNTVQQQLLLGGVVEEILDKYKKAPDDFYPVAAPYAAAP